MRTRTVVVTGATSGIGRSAARAMAKAGWSVWAAGRDPHAVTRVADEIKARPLVLDVTDAASIAAAADTIQELDALVNNAGIQPDFDFPLLQATVSVMSETFTTNLFAVVALTNALLPRLRESASPRIVNVSSGTASFGWSTGPNPQFDYEAAADSGGRFAVYRSSKAALNMITLLYAQALAGDGFKVNAIAPGARRTNLNAAGRHGRGQDPAEAGAGIKRLLEFPDDSPTGKLYSYDGHIAPW